MGAVEASLQRNSYVEYEKLFHKWYISTEGEKQYANIK